MTTAPLYNETDVLERIDNQGFYNMNLGPFIAALAFQMFMMGVLSTYTFPSGLVLGLWLILWNPSFADLDVLWGDDASCLHRVWGCVLTNYLHRPWRRKTPDGIDGSWGRCSS